MATGWQRYEKIEEVGRGACGVVYRCRDLEDGSLPYDADNHTNPDWEPSEEVAVKCVQLGEITDTEARLAMTESAILRNLKHKNILRYIDCFIDDQNQLCLVTEFVDGGDLASMIWHGKRKQTNANPVPHPLQTSAIDTSQGGDDGGETFIDALVVADIAEQLLTGLSYLHENGVVHRDIKPANIYITRSGVIKIGDFGVSTLLSQTHSKAKTFIGTPFYLCPEVCLGQPYDHGADVWSCGVMLYELYCNKLPFVAQHIYLLVDVISQGKYDRGRLARRPFSSNPSTSQLSEPLQQNICFMVRRIIENCLTSNPDERPTARSLLENHCNPNATGETQMTEATCGLNETLQSLPPLPPEDSYDPLCNITDMLDCSSTVYLDQTTGSVMDEPLIIMNRQDSEASTMIPIGDFLATPGGHDDRSSADSAPLAPHQMAHRRRSSQHFMPQGIAGNICRWANIDPVALENRIRERALLLHRKRHAVTSRRRQLEREAVERTERIFQERREKEDSECWNSPTYSSPTRRFPGGSLATSQTGSGGGLTSPEKSGIPPEESDDTPMDDVTRLAQSRAKLRDSCKPLNLQQLQHATLRESQNAKSSTTDSPFKRLMMQRPDLMDQVRKVSFQIVQQEQALSARENELAREKRELEERIRRTNASKDGPKTDVSAGLPPISSSTSTAPSRRHSLASDGVSRTHSMRSTTVSGSTEEEDLPLTINVIIIARNLERTGETVAVKCTTGTGFKKLKKRLIKVLGMDPEEDDLPGELMYMDTDGDLVKVTAGKHWRHVLEDHQKRKGGHALHMRLV